MYRVWRSILAAVGTNAPVAVRWMDRWRSRYRELSSACATLWARVQIHRLVVSRSSLVVREAETNDAARAIR
jgi:hypothetical protein